MSDPVVFVQNGDKIFAVPTSVCEQYELSGKGLEAAKVALIGDGDVSGQTDVFDGMEVTGSDGTTYIFVPNEGAVARNRNEYNETDGYWRPRPW